MNTTRNASVILIALVVAGIAAQAVMAQEQMKAPTPDVPELYTIKGQFTRIAYNNEGWITLGYRTANSSQGDEWMLLEAGVNILKPHPNHTLTRADFSVKMPDGSMVPMLPDCRSPADPPEMYSFSWSEPVASETKPIPNNS